MKKLASKVDTVYRLMIELVLPPEMNAGLDCHPAELCLGGLWHSANRGEQETTEGMYV